MGKHSKQLKSEKSKVHLKKKQLPKGHNITDPSFKVKKIAILEQLRTHGDEPHTAGNKNLKDLLNQLMHHNVTAQLSSLKGIKELFSANPELANGLNLRRTITGVLDLCVADVEKKVRREAVKLLSSIVSPLSTLTLESFNEIMSKQLQRGLSHINPYIQADSMRLLDLVMSVAAPKEKKVLMILLSLLIRMVTATGDSAVSRLSVVQRIKTLCRSMLSGQSNDAVVCKEVTWHSRLIPLTSLYKSYPKLNLEGKKRGQMVQDGDKHTHLEKLMVALLGVWTECTPDQFLTENATNLLRMVVDTILLLCRYLDEQESDPDSANMKSWFRSTFKKSVSHNLMNHFPYQSVDTITKSTRQADYVEEETLPPLVGLNLSLAQLYYWLKLQRPHLEQKIDKYIFECLDSVPVSSEMISLLEILLSIKSKQEAALTGMASSCMARNDPKLSNLLCHVVLEPESASYLKHPVVSEWVRSLAENLATASKKNLIVLATLASRNAIQDLDQVICPEVPSVLLSCKKHLSLDDRHRAMLDLFYWTVSHDDLTLFIQDTPSLAVKKYLTNILG